MSRATLKAIQAAAGNAGEAVYADDVFSTYLYEGTGSAQTITNGIDLSGEGGLVWRKQRTANSWTVYTSHSLSDTETGTNLGLMSDKTDAQQIGGDSFVTAFNTNGFSISLDSSGFGTNKSGERYVSWTFRKQPGFFDVVTYTGNGVAGTEIPHNLGSVPGLIIVKLTSGSGGWIVFHRSLGNTKYLQLNSTNAEATQSWPWNNTSPTATHFTVGTGGNINASGDTYVAYLFAHDAQDFGTDSDESIIKCGSYTGTGSAGNSINLGFEPQWLMIKQTSGVNDWYMYDTMRGITTGGNDTVGLKANSSDAEGSSNHLSVTSTGFELEGIGGGYNGSGATYIYVAIRRPHKPAEEFAATDLFAIDTRSASNPGFTSGFPVDFQIYKDSSGSNGYLTNRLTGGKYLFADSTAAESVGFLGGNNGDFDYNDGWLDSTATISTLYSWMFRRAPGFFDVVAYTGTGVSPMNVPHNLGVTPELIITKARTSGDTYGWWTYPLFVSDAYGNTGKVKLNDNTAYGSTGWTPPMATSTAITVPSPLFSNKSGESYVAYLFATVNGISKLGTYTGTGSDVNVNCGFTSGARFVLVKRTDSTGDWYVWDSVRGIVAGNDPYLLLNSTAAQVTGTDYIDPLSSGFTITSTAPAALNASGGTYLFLAIA